MDHERKYRMPSFEPGSLGQLFSFLGFKIALRLPIGRGERTRFAFT
jgi:hypothetical protein